MRRILTAYAASALSLFAGCDGVRESQANAEAVQSVRTEIVMFGEEHAPDLHRLIVAAEQEVAQRELLLGSYTSKVRAAGEEPSADPAYHRLAKEFADARAHLQKLTEARKKAYLTVQAEHHRPETLSAAERREREARTRAALRELDEVTGAAQQVARPSSPPAERAVRTEPKKQQDASAPGGLARTRMKRVAPVMTVSGEAERTQSSGEGAAFSDAAEAMDAGPAAKETAHQRTREVLRAPPPGSGGLQRSPLLSAPKRGMRFLPSLH
jgi:hypothetical protein